MELVTTTKKYKKNKKLKELEHFVWIYIKFVEIKKCVYFQTLVAKEL